MNSVILSGRLTNDIELKQTTTGKDYIHTCLAVERIGSEGTDFINLKAFDNVAKSMANWTKKGTKILVTGKMSVYKKETNGKNLTYTDVVVSTWEFCESKQKSESSSDSFMAIPDGINDDSMPFN